MKKGAATAVAGAFLTLALVVSLLAFLLSGGVSKAVNDSQDCTPTQVTQVSADGAADAPSADDGAQGVNTAARAALRAGWTGTEAVTAVAVAGAESGYNPKAANATSTARGMWQVMLSYHQPKFDGDSWEDPYANARVAHIIWKDAGGWGPWVAYTSGAYRKHIPEAKAAIAKVSGAAAPVLGRPAPSVDGPEQTAPGLQAVAKRAAQVVRDRFGFNGTIGGFSDRNIAGTNQKSKHASGLAIDVMLPVGALSNRIADYFAGPGYAAYGVDNVIHNRRIYNKARGWHTYTGVSPHTDHVHIDFLGDAAATGTEAVPASGTSLGALADTAGCEPTDPALAYGAGSGSTVYPLDSGTKFDRKNYGGTGSSWARGHTGTDFSVPCGTPVKAATAGTIQIDTTALWAGRWLVKVSTGPSTLSTWYAHMQSLSVTAGEQVQAGQPIGRVGSLGNSTGCHLHFEVHPKNGGIYEDGVNPTPWLAANVGKSPTIPALGPGVGATTGDSFVLASFNALGNSHTEPGGHSPRMASGTVRTGWMLDLMRARNISVAGLQEVQPKQHAAFRRLSSDYAMWHMPGGKGNNAANPVIWRKTDWTLAGATVITVPYFHGTLIRIPVVQLRQTGSGRVITIINTHNPANVHGPAAQWRRTAETRELATATRLAAGGAQVFLTGDMNDRAVTFCRLTATGVLHAANGGTNSGACRPPKGLGIDWIFGSKSVAFGGYTKERSALVSRTSDHPLIYTLVR